MRFFFAVIFIGFLSAGFIFSERSEGQETVSALKDSTFRMSINRPRGTFLFEWTDLIYTEVFKRLNIRFKSEYQPLKRAGVETNAGRMDGEPARVYNYSSLYPNLIRVDESVFPMTVNAYTTDSSVAGLNGWKSLHKTTFRVEYPLGMKTCEEHLSEMVKPELLTEITTTFQGLSKLILNRTDIYIDDFNSVRPFLQGDSEFKGKIFVAGTMEKVPLYMFVNKKHEAMISQLEKIIRTLKTEGLIEKFRKKAMDNTGYQVSK